MIEWRRRCFLPSFLAETFFTIWTVLIKQTVDNRKLPSKWYGHFGPSGPLTLYHMAGSFPFNADSDSMYRLQGNQRSGLLRADAVQDQIKIATTSRPGWPCTTLKKGERHDRLLVVNSGSGPTANRRGLL